MSPKENGGFSAAAAQNGHQDSKFQVPLLTLFSLTFQDFQSYQRSQILLQVFRS